MVMGRQLDGRRLSPSLGTNTVCDRCQDGGALCRYRTRLNSTSSRGVGHPLVLGIVMPSGPGAEFDQLTLASSISSLAIGTNAPSAHSLGKKGWSSEGEVDSRIPLKKASASSITGNTSLSINGLPVKILSASALLLLLYRS
ncbi:hypothetical protein QE152_g22782 [Popillia japonica]|uniref:Uncharacterized protein n=1 Tax=Popillia japonica TaxID=7064 RepID=A0AAW1KHJ2_POPJA